MPVRSDGVDTDGNTLAPSVVRETEGRGYFPVHVMSLSRGRRTSRLLHRVCLSSFLCLVCFYDHLLISLVCCRVEAGRGAIRSRQRGVRALSHSSSLNGVFCTINSIYLAFFIYGVMMYNLLSSSKYHG